MSFDGRDECLNLGPRLPLWILHTAKFTKKMWEGESQETVDFGGKKWASSLRRGSGDHRFSS